MLGKNPELTAVAITYVDPRDWVVAGRPAQPSRARIAFIFDIKVADETNTKAEKAEYVQGGVRRLQARLLGNLHEESYILMRRRTPHDLIRLRRTTQEIATITRPREVPRAGLNLVVCDYPVVSPLLRPRTPSATASAESFEI